MDDIKRQPVNAHRMDKSRIITLSAYFAITAIEIVLSLFSVGLNFNNIKDWAGFWGNVLIQDALIIALMYVAMKDGGILFRTSDKYKFLKALNVLVDRAWTVMKRGLAFAFRGYSHSRYEANRLDYLRFRLQKCGLSEVRILSFTYAELDSLLAKETVKSFDGKDIGFDIITPEQYLVVKALKEGHYTYEEIPSDWFLSNISSQDSDLYSFYSRAADNRKKAKVWSVIYRIIMIGLLSAYWAAAFIDTSNMLNAQAWVNTITRTGTAIGAIVSGYIAAKEDADSEAEEMTYKSSFIDGFFSDYNSGVFVPKDMTEEVKEKLAKLEAVSDKV